MSASAAQGGHNKHSKRNLIRNFRQTCGASAGDVVTAKSLPADSPHCESVVWSRSQTTHCDCGRSSWCRHWVASKFVSCRWLCWCPSERQRSTRWVHKLTRSVKTWCWVIYAQTQSFWSKLAIRNLSVHALKNIPRRLNVTEMERDFHPWIGEFLVLYRQNTVPCTTLLVSFISWFTWSVINRPSTDCTVIDSSCEYFPLDETQQVHNTFYLS